MIKLIMNFMKPHGGEILVLGETFAARGPEILSRIGYVPERPHLYSGLTVAEAMEYHAAFYRSWNPARAADLLQRFGLLTSATLSRLSKGEMGKVMMLLALSTTPELLILDEPTDGLDPVVRRDVIQVLLEFVSQHGATVFISSHLVHELERICDWVGVLDVGKLIAELPMDAFKSGIKKLRIQNAPRDLGNAPFMLLGKDAQLNGRDTETWTVNGWDDSMKDFFADTGASLKEVIDVDLEDGFVELLKSFRADNA